MRWLVAALLLIVASAAQAQPAAAPAPVPEERRVALLIGNDTYEGSPLTNPSRDVRRVGETLRGLGFFLVGGGPQLNLDKAGMERALRDFRAYLGPGAVAFFYFSGHGMSIRDTSYLVPIGADAPRAEARADEVFVNARSVVELLGASGSRLSMIVLDACRVIVFRESLRERVTQGLASLNAPNGVLIAYTTQPGNVASDGDPNAPSGPYSSALIGAMQAPGLGFVDVFNRTGLEVSRNSNGVQRPWLAISPIEGNFYFTPPGATPGQVAVVPPAPPRPAVPTTRDCPDCPELVSVPAGSFTMGSDAGKPDERPPHPVTIARPFALGRTEVTFAEYDACVAAGACRRRPEDEGWGRGRQPVINVSWSDAHEYTAWLSQRTGRRYRLPSEAEWEYAALGGSTARAGLFGYANCWGCGSDWDHRQAGPVGSFRANGYGLHDMLGNVWEWVEDCIAGDYRAAPVDGAAAASPAGAACTRRGLRGGSWADLMRLVRISNRGGADPATRNYLIGFRVLRE
jgi:formylglycine-generating enzyme required for sulfatase activity